MRKIFLSLVHTSIMEIHANSKIDLSFFSSYEEFRKLILQAVTSELKFIQIIKKEVVVDIILEKYCIVDDEFIQGKNIFDDYIETIHFRKIKTICFYNTYQKYKLDCLPDYDVIGEIMGRVIYNFDVIRILYVNSRGVVTEHKIVGAYINEVDKDCWITPLSEIYAFKKESLAYHFNSRSILSIKIYNLDMSRIKEKMINGLNIEIPQEKNIYNKIDYTDLCAKITFKQQPYLTDSFYTDIKNKLKRAQCEDYRAGYLILLRSPLYRDMNGRSTIINIWETIKSFYQLSNYFINGIFLELLYTIDSLNELDPALKLHLLINEMEDKFYTIINLYNKFGYEESKKLYSSKLNINGIVKTIKDNEKRKLEKILTADIIKDVYREFGLEKRSTKRDIKQRLRSIIDKAEIEYRVTQLTISYFYKVIPSNSKTPAIYTIKERLF